MYAVIEAGGKQFRVAPGDKVLVFKFKRKKQYKRTIGHRQNYTEVKIDDIVA